MAEPESSRGSLTLQSIAKAVTRLPEARPDAESQRGVDHPYNTPLSDTLYCPLGEFSDEAG